MRLMEKKHSRKLMRLNVFIAHCGFSSRRSADELIKKGQVKVNGRVIKEPWFKVKEKDKVLVKGNWIRPKNFVYLAFYKPRGVVTTLKDKFASKTVNDYLSPSLKGVYPVGRLDKYSEGLLLLTNDGDFCYRLTHPKFRVEKEYFLELKGKVIPSDLKKALKGVYDEGEFLKVDKIMVDERSRDRTRLRVIIREGKKRELRRIFRKLGFGIALLKRIRIANIRIGRLKPGELKVINKENAFRKL